MRYHSIPHNVWQPCTASLFTKSIRLVVQGCCYRQDGNKQQILIINNK